MFKQNFTTNAHKLAGTDEYSPDLCNIYFKDDHLYVTNAHVALKQHLKHHNIIDWQHLNGKSIHYQIFAFIKNRFIRVTAKEDYFECFDKYNNKATFPYTSSTMDIAEMIENAIAVVQLSNAIINSGKLQLSAYKFANSGDAPEMFGLPEPKNNTTPISQMAVLTPEDKSVLNARDKHGSMLRFAKEKEYKNTSEAMGTMGNAEFKVAYAEWLKQ